MSILQTSAVDPSSKPLNKASNILTPGQTRTCQKLLLIISLSLLVFSLQAQDCCPQNAWELTEFEVRQDPITNTSAINSTTLVAPIVVDLDDNGILDPEIITIGISEFNNRQYDVDEIIITPNNLGSVAQTESIPVDINYANTYSLAAGDVLTNIPGAELIYIDASDQLHIISEIRNINNAAPIDYEDDIIGEVSGNNRVPLIADLNEDGSPEIYVSNEVFYQDNAGNWSKASAPLNSNLGSPLYQLLGSNSDTSNINDYLAYQRDSANTNSIRMRYNLPVAVDILGNVPGKELVIGNQIFSFDGTGLVLQYDANIIPINNLGSFNIDSLQDGYTSVGDVDGDDRLEVVVNGTVIMTDGNIYFGLYVYDPSSNTLKGFIHSTSTPDGGHFSGRAVTLGEVDANIPGAEIIWLETNQISIHNITLGTPNYSYWTNNNGIQATLEVDDASGLTGVTTFDFNGDGTVELVYRDESNIRVIYGGNDPAILNSLTDPSTRNWFIDDAGSGTGSEYPVIADYDADNEAEIITVGSESARDNSGSVRVFESGNIPWNKTVPYWNQNQYYYVNLETPPFDEPLTLPGLTIPVSQTSQLQEIDGQTPYNLFLGQPSIARDSIIYLPDLTLEVLSSNCDEVVLNICNLCEEPSPDQVQIQVFSTNPFVESTTAIASLNLNTALAEGVCETLSFSTTGIEGPLYFMLNDNGNVFPVYQSNNGDRFINADFRECDYLNNIDSTIVSCPRNCEDLGNSLFISNWQAEGGVNRSQGGPGQDGNNDQYLRLTQSGSTPGNFWVTNNDSYGGSFAEDLGDCLCFDVYVRNPVEVSGPQAYTPTVRLFQGMDANSSNFYATFTASTSLTPFTGWQRICMPLAECTFEGLPENEDGSWSMTSPGDPCADWNALLQNFTGISILVDGSSFPLSIGIDNFCFEDCNLTAPSNCPATLTTTTEDDCSHSLSYSEIIIGQSDIRAVRLTALGGNTFDVNKDVLAPGFSMPQYSPLTRTIVKADGSNFSEVEDDFFAFTFHDIETAQQLIQVEYLNFDLSVSCTDTLTFECPIPEDCLKVSADTLTCSDSEPGYRLQLNFTVPNDNYTEGVGRIRVNVTAPVDFTGGIIYDFPVPLTPGESISIDTLLPTTFDYFGDTLKVFVTAHDGPEERLCCFADSLSLPFPQCTDCGTPFLTTIDIPLEDTPGQCCYEVFLTSNANGDDFLDSMYLDVIPLTMGSDVGIFTPDPNSIWNYDLASSTPIRFQFSSEVPTNTGVPEVLGTICVERMNTDFEVSLFADLIDSETLDHCFTDIFFDSFCPALSPCDSLQSYILPASEDCCYDVYLNNNYTEDSSLLRAVTVNFIGGPVDTFSGRSLIATAPGWNFATEEETLRRYTLTPSGMEIPLGNDQRVFQFCVAESFSRDSTYVEIAWQTATDTLCADTVAAICQNCLSIEEPADSCDDFSPTYTFTFTNFSNIPGNKIRIIDAVGFPNVIGTQDTIALTEMIGPGETYSGTITVDLPDALEGQEACFDIILEHVLPDQSPIRCCYLTHCVDVKVCGSGSLVPEGGEVLITAFPNPANTTVSIASQQTGLANLKLLSFTGHSVVEREVNFIGTPVPVELGQRPPGVYTLLVRFADGTQGIRRIVIR